MKPTLAVAGLLLAIPALADPEGMPQAVAVLPDAAPVTTPPERPFLFTADPSLPAPGHGVLTAGLGNVTRTGQERPVGAGQGVPTLGAEVGVLSRVALTAEAGFAFASPGQALESPAAIQAGARFLLTDPASRHWQAAAGASYGRDFAGASSLKLDGTVAWNPGRVRAVASVSVAHAFVEGADGVDWGASAGVSVALPAGFRAGAEAVATDLEEIAVPQAEHGATSFAGPTVGWEWGERLQLVAGPAVGVGPGSPHATLLARGAATLKF